jgi:hypothetical protein
LQELFCRCKRADIEAERGHEASAARISRRSGSIIEDQQLRTGPTISIVDDDESVRHLTVHLTPPRRWQSSSENYGGRRRSNFSDLLVRSCPKNMQRRTFARLVDELWDAWLSDASANLGVSLDREALATLGPTELDDIAQKRATDIALRRRRRKSSN